MAEGSAAPAYRCNGQPVDAARFYALACDPARAVAIEACAGAGKTWILVTRMLRALLLEAERADAGGTPFRPDAVLAITFTRLAAAEMRQRLAQELQLCARADEPALRGLLLERGMPEAQITAQRCRTLGTLQARVLASERQVQIRTFHGWFASLLRVAPLAVLEGLGLPARFVLLEDDEEALRRVWRPFHEALVAEPAAQADYEAAVQAHGRHQTLKALETALQRRSEFLRADRVGAVERGVAHFRDRFAACAGLDDPAQALSGDAARARWLGWAQALGRAEGKSAPKAAAALVGAFERPADDLPGAQARLEALRSALFVAGEHRLNKNLEKFDAARAAEAELAPLCAARDQHQAWIYQQRMARLTRRLLDGYRRLKQAQSWVDMADVEDAAEHLLTDPVVGAWIQERLDQQIRHLLIDEFQDTNPAQWQTLQAWLGSYSGAGASMPGLFLVGDPKQSIYRFRRAEPAVFLAAQAFVRDGLEGDLLSCDHTRRNAPAVIEAVNAAFRQPQLAAQFTGFRAHTTHSAEAGGVGALPPIARAGASPPAQAASALPAWRDSLEGALEEPEDGLRTLEARQAAAYLADRIAQGTAPGRIMVLSRRRANLAPMRDALRERGIASQIGEKAALADCAEVQDLVALLDVLCSPGHDHSLARALKSPLFGLDDAALVWLHRAASRASLGWFASLPGADQPGPAPLKAAAARLRRWQGWVRSLPPHDALQAIYDDGDVLAAYAASTTSGLRGATLDNLRAFLSASLEHEGGRFATPYRLVRAFRAPGGVKAPAALEPDAVRLLTIHGAKGLEADLVLMLDTDATRPSSDTMAVLVDWPPSHAHPRRFIFLASEAQPPGCARDAMAAELTQRRREECNALYVAMTRARRELVVSSIASARPDPQRWWALLEPLCAPIPIDAAAPDAGSGAAPVEPVFELVTVPQPPSPPAPEPLPADFGGEHGAQSRVGQAMHRLLEWGDLGDSALRSVARLHALDPGQLERARDGARRILDGPAGWAFRPERLRWAGNEVALQHEGEALRVDRLVCARSDGDWWVLDYKLGADPLAQEELRAQLARYQRAVALAFPAQRVRAAFLTAAGELIEPVQALCVPATPGERS